MDERLRPHERRRGAAAPALLVVCLVVLGLTGCARKRPVADPAYAAEIEKWRAHRLASLTSENGWLTLVGIHWLKAGPNTFGAATDNDIVLVGDGVPATAGTLDLAADGTVTLHAAPGAHITTAGTEVTEMPLHTDRSGKPDVLTLGGLRMHLIDRSGSIALRVRDPKSPRRTGFEGLHYFPIDPGYRVTARYERYPVPREASVASAQGPAQKMLVPGILRFKVGDKEATLEPFVSTPADEEFFIVFSDATAGHETYGAGRFLDAAAPKGDATDVTLDFNEAYSPPCAFSPYATCPLPPRQNVLPFRVEAGEQVTGSH